MLKDYKKLLKKRPLVAGIIGLSAVYAGYTVISSYGFSGIGASTSTTTSSSASHAMMNRPSSGDLMTHPTALYGISGHCTGGVHGACSNPHCNVHGGMNGLGSMSTSTSSPQFTPIRELPTTVKILTKRPLNSLVFQTKSKEESL